MPNTRAASSIVGGSCAQDAANALKESAQESLEKVKAEGQGAAQTVKESAQESKDAVQRDS